MAQVHGIINGEKLFWNAGAWCMEPQSAEELTIPEAHRRLRIINANNRFLDREDQIEAEVVESH